MRRVVANHVEYWRVGSRGVVQIRDTVRVTRSKVEQGECWLIRHSAEAVGSSGYHAFEQAENRSDSWLFIERCHQLHF